MTVNGDDGASSWDEASQLGQLFMMGFDGTTVNDQVRTLIEKHRVGTIMLTAKNLKSAEQTQQLVLELQNIAHRSGHAVPLLIAIDQENGGVNSLFDENHIRQFPSAMGMAATGVKELTKYVARATAQELAACGINWILGPVIDVLTNAKSQPLGVRSFGDDPSEVSALVGESLNGYQEGGLATCGKHFPSYGNLEFFGAPTDVPTITETLEQLSQTALVPFRNSIAQGIDAMMVGGVALSSPSINVMHACLSEQIVRDLLRNQMHFEGVVVSECLEMEALSRNIGISGGTVMAFKAGCDVMLTCRNLSVQEEAINGLKAGLDNGMIERFRVQESLQRIIHLKHRFTSWEKALAPAGIQQLAKLQQLHTNLSTKAYNKSITIVRDQKGNLPLSKILREDQELLLLTPLIKPLPTSTAHQQAHKSPFSPDWNFSNSEQQNNPSSVDTSSINGETVFRDLGRSLARQRHGKVTHTSYTANGLRPLHETLLNRASAVIIVTADATRNMYQQGFTKHVATLCKIATGPDGSTRDIPCVVVAVSSPFDFAADTSIGTYVCTYDFTETALQALVRILYGEQSATGALPGSLSQPHQAPPKTTVTRQQWLVEAFSEERDLSALSKLLSAIATSNTPVAVLSNATAKSFLIRDPDVTESHFVVRNSTTKELLGFCATYFVKATMTGHIGAIIVDPKRRKLSVGRSLHDRAVRALIRMKGVQKFKLGVRLPTIFPGIPKTDLHEGAKLRKWFTSAGWNTSTENIRSVHSMLIDNLTTWTPPEKLTQALKNPNVTYDLVHGTEHAEAILKHVKSSADSTTLAMYKSALGNSGGCAIIRARLKSDDSVLGTVLLFRDQARLARFIPTILEQGISIAGISCPVVISNTTNGVTDATANGSNTSKEISKASLLQSLLLLGSKHLKKQDMQKAVLDHVSDNSVVEQAKVVGFDLWRSYEEVSSDPASWKSMLPT